MIIDIYYNFNLLLHFPPRQQLYLGLTLIGQVDLDDSKKDSKSDQLEEETKGLEKLSGDIRLFFFNFNKNIETNLPIKKNIQENDSTFQFTYQSVIPKSQEWLKITL